MPKVTYRPVNGLKVPNPETGKALKKNGEPVEDSGYWRRQRRAGAVELVEAEEAEKNTAAKIPKTAQAGAADNGGAK